MFALVVFSWFALVGAQSMFLVALPFAIVVSSLIYCLWYSINIFLFELVFAFLLLLFFLWFLVFIFNQYLYLCRHFFLLFFCWFFDDQSMFLLVLCERVTQFARWLQNKMNQLQQINSSYKVHLILLKW
jgi:hypothetical protein